MEEMMQYLRATDLIDAHHPDIRNYAAETVGSSKDAVEMAVRLYYAVRDGIRYDPYYPFFLYENYRASRVLTNGRGFCIPKVSLLCALGRACGIPCRPGFAHVRNHLATPELLEFMGSDLFVFHAFTEFYLEGKWVKATPAFNRELCERHDVAPLEFNGREDSIFQPYNREQNRFMEYVQFLDSYSDIPVDEIIASFRETYGTERVQGWVDNYEKYGDIRPRTIRDSKFEIRD